MKTGQATIGLAVALVVVFGLEVATNSVGNDSALLKLGALPDNGELHGQYWRLATYSMLHFNWVHLLVNVLLLLWVGRIVEKRVGMARAGAIYVVSVLSSAAVILLVHKAYPKIGVTVGASGGIFGLLGAALVFSYRRDAALFGELNRLRIWLWTVLFIGFGISFLPEVSMAGHVGGVIGGLLLAFIVSMRKNAPGVEV